jgi:hypothetical protein
VDWRAPWRAVVGREDNSEDDDSNPDPTSPFDGRLRNVIRRREAAAAGSAAPHVEAAAAGSADADSDSDVDWNAWYARNRRLALEENRRLALEEEEESAAPHAAT